MAQEKREYRAPKLERMGKVEDLTLKGGKAYKKANKGK